MSVGKQIRLYLIEKGISQTWVSEQARIALPKLNASLNDKRKLDVEELKILHSIILEVDKKTLKSLDIIIKNMKNMQ